MTEYISEEKQKNMSSTKKQDIHDLLKNIQIHIEKNYVDDNLFDGISEDEKDEKEVEDEKKDPTYDPSPPSKKKKEEKKEEKKDFIFITQAEVNRKRKVYVDEFYNKFRKEAIKRLEDISVSIAQSPHYTRFYFSTSINTHNTKTLEYLCNRFNLENLTDIKLQVRDTEKRQLEFATSDIDWEEYLPPGWKK